MRTLHYYNLPFYKHTHYTKASKLHYYYYTDASITFLCTIEGLIAWKGGPTYWQIPCQALLDNVLCAINFGTHGKIYVLHCRKIFQSIIFCISNFQKYLSDKNSC